MRFDAFFQKATGSDPYPFQQRFAEGDLPHLLRAPTGAGKTATAVLGWLWRYRHGGKPTPRRLVYCLPMRVLVEQSEREAREWVRRLGLDVPVHVLMGGVEKADWFLEPEKPAVLIGTQDMLLSRALNRGYAATRFHWPIDFGLLNTDCLWVFDEPQLMGSGVSTSAQLAGLRKQFVEQLPAFGECPSVWMSATLEPGWLDTIDFRGRFPGAPLELSDDDHAPGRPLHKRMTATKTLHRLEAPLSKDMKEAADAVLARHRESPDTQTLVILNTVDRAKAVYAALAAARKKGDSPHLLLVHSRFRPNERTQLNKQLQGKGEATTNRIIVATQVVEAGVDISARTLVTELAPWASVVQRIGRCNRTGDDGPGRVFWIDSSARDPDKKEDKSAALPYSVADLVFARGHLNQLDGQSVSPKALDDYKKANETPDAPFLRFEHTHVLRRRDLLDLFDTAADLSGNDIDVSRFVRGDDPDADVQVFWRVGPPDSGWSVAERRRQAARREELCNVPIGSFKKEFLEAGKTAYRWDFLDEEWRELGKRDTGTVVPGQVFWIPTDQGGYDLELGWYPSAGALPDTFPLPGPPKPEVVGPDAFDGDDWSRIGWRTIVQHTDEVTAELAEIVRATGLSGAPAAALALAARWHDWGKAHPVFQDAIRSHGRNPLAVRRWKEAGGPEPPESPRPEEHAGARDLAKAPDGYWRRYERRRFRHELASAFGILSAGRDLPGWAGVPEDVRDLAVYLIAAHHGKVRLSVRTMPDEKPPSDPDRLFACGVRQRDQLPPVSLGTEVQAPEMELNLSPMLLGGESSWSGRALKLLADLGPFKLAYLEALLRAADCRASAKADTRTEADDD